jgi:hypothetical protein
MRRMSVLLSVITVVLLGLFAIAYDPPGTTAQEATPGATAGHPFVGAWRMNNPAMPEEAPILVVLHADGTYVQTEADGSVGIGSWVATGERSVAVTFVEQVTVAQETTTTFTFRAIGQVSPTGDTFTGTYTVEMTGPDGVSQGEYGPGTVEATRVAVEPMGTPVGSLEDLFAQLEPAPKGATPVP